MQLPKILDIGFKVVEAKLWSLDLPVEEIDISDIEYNLDIPYLEKMGTNDWNLTPRMLVQNWDTETFHARQAERADTQFPIDIFKVDDKWIILDGVHRFARIVKEGKSTVRVRKVPRDAVDKIKDSDTSYLNWKGNK